MNLNKIVYDVKTIREISGDVYARSMVIDTRAIDKEARTVKMAFSSEEPVRRFFGYEILDHSPKSVDLSRLKDGGAVLVDHDHRDHVGVVESVSIDADRVGRVTVRFGNSERATEIFNDITDGIRKHVSVGYRVNSMKLEESNNDDDTYRIDSWTPHEVSFTAIPADTSVGVGRAYPDNSQPVPTNIKPKFENIRSKEMDPEKTVIKEDQAPQPKEPKIDVVAVREEARKAEVKRIREIESAGKKFDMAELAREFINDGKSVEDFRAVLLDNIQERGAPQQSVAFLDLSKKDVKTYSLMRAINAAYNNDWKGAEFELECSRAIEEEIGREPQGFYIPVDIQERDLNTGVDGEGGHLKGTDHLAGSFIESLRSESVIGKLGARFLTGLVGDVDIPKIISGSMFYWLNEGGTVTDSDPVFGNVTLSPKTVAGSVPMTRRLMKQSSPSVESIVMGDLVMGAATAIDIAALAGTGTANQPLGILNQVGINTQAVADATNSIPTFAEAVGFETAVAEDNALTGSLAYVTTPSIRGGMKVTPKDAGSGIMVMEGNQVNGYPCLATTNIGAGNTVFGNFNSLLVGAWGVLDVLPDRATNASSAGLVLRVFQDIDFAVRHAQSFCKNA